jgi:hypothetical protein
MVVLSGPSVDVDIQNIVESSEPFGIELIVAVNMCLVAKVIIKTNGSRQGRTCRFYRTGYSSSNMWLVVMAESSPSASLCIRWWTVTLPRSLSE